MALAFAAWENRPRRSLQRFEEGDEIVDLIGVQSEFRHGGMPRDDPFPERLLQAVHRIARVQGANSGAILSWLPLTLSSA